jgi:hypothetical protein
MLPHDGEIGQSRRKMMPKTKLGKWAGGLLVVFVVLLAALIYGMNVAGWQPGTPLSITVGTCAMIAGIATFVTAVISLVKFKDRSFAVFLAVIIGLIAVLIATIEVGEVLHGARLIRG